MKGFAGLGCWRVWEETVPVYAQGSPVSALLPPPPLTLAAEVVLEDAAPSAGAVDMALVSEQTQVLAAPVVDATRGEFA